MNNELKKIKKIYGEDTMHLCRTLFPSILEHEGLLLSILQDYFAPTKFLAQEIISQHKEENFKNYIFSFIDVEDHQVLSNKSPQELMKMAGYTLYECHTEEDIQKFKKYYAPGEALCTFNGGRLNSCYVFFAVKDNVAEIKRENFREPRREDEYGTSVMSIQFSKDSSNTLSIKNRYNHRVNNPDNTYYNNLENIMVGLTRSFENAYDLKINSNAHTTLELDNFCFSDDGKYHHYSIENQNTYFCENNYLVKNHHLIDIYANEKERYIMLDTYVIDLKEKKLINLLPQYQNEFDNIINETSNILVSKGPNKTRKITIENSDKKPIELVIDGTGNIIFFSDENTEYIGSNFMRTNVGLKKINIPNVKQIGDSFLILNRDLEEIDLPNVSYIGNFFCANAQKIKSVNLPNLIKAGNDFLEVASALITLKLPSLEYVGKSFLGEASSLQILDVPKLKDVGEFFLLTNRALETAYFPSLVLNDNGDLMHYFGFLRDNRNLKTFYVNDIDEETLPRFFRLNPWLQIVYNETLQYDEMTKNGKSI